MKRPAVFFDRDNTLIVNDGYLGDPSKVVLVDGAAEAVARVRSLGYAVVAFSNQSGVARGIFSEDDVHRVNQRIDELLADAHPQAIIDRHEFCPFHPEGTVTQYAVESDLRKPKPGMILQAAQKLALDLERSWVIGDAPRDIEAGKAAGCRTIWYKDGRLPPSTSARELMLTVPDAVVSTLKEATDVIAREALVRHSGPPEAAPVQMRQAPQAEQTPAEPQPQMQSPPPATAESSWAGRGANQAASSERNSVPDESAARQEPDQPPARPTGPRSLSSAKPLIKALAAKRDRGTDEESQIEAESSNSRLEDLAEQILEELHRRSERPEADFSISKLLAGIIQIIALALLVMACLPAFQSYFQSMALVAIFLQTFTIALLIMGRQR